MISHPVYRDYADLGDEWIAEQRLEIDSTRLKKSDIKEMFPTKLHTMLESISQTPYSFIVRWLAHGRAFKVYEKNLFARDVLPLYFPAQSEFLSFQRQLNLYGFFRLTGRGCDQNSYYHPFLLRGKPKLCQLIRRREIAENNVRRRFDPKTEPDFYNMTALSGGAMNSTTSLIIPPNMPQRWHASSPVENGNRAAATSWSRSRQTLGGLKSTGLSDESVVEASALSLHQRDCRIEQSLMRQSTMTSTAHRSGATAATARQQHFYPLDYDELNLSQHQHSFASHVGSMKRSRDNDEQPIYTMELQESTRSFFDSGCTGWQSAQHAEQPRSLRDSMHAAGAATATTLTHPSARGEVVPGERDVDPIMTATLSTLLIDETERGATITRIEDSSIRSDGNARKRFRLIPTPYTGDGGAETKEDVRSPTSLKRAPPPACFINRRNAPDQQDLDAMSDSEDFSLESTGHGWTQGMEQTADWMESVTLETFWF